MCKVLIYKEKKIKKFRIRIAVYGRNEIGLYKEKKYSIIGYFNKEDLEKIGVLIYLIKDHTDKELVLDDNIYWSKDWFNLPSSKKVMEKYNLISFSFFDEKYLLELYEKDGNGFSASEKKWGTYYFETKPTEKKLGEKILELFERKEKEEGIE